MNYSQMTLSCLIGVRVPFMRGLTAITGLSGAYYAAQVGITLKPKAPASRTYLIGLLDALERMKSAIGDNDAVHDESAAGAYVENFALKVFAMADNEDRRGEATRYVLACSSQHGLSSETLLLRFAPTNACPFAAWHSGTAKKFLAAANFLEILRTFDKEKPDSVSPAPDSTEEKIRYAKWKAADIAKAFREGRKPTAGPAGSEPEIAVSPESPPAEAPSITRTTPPPPAITDLPGPPQDGFFQQQPPPAHVPDELLAHTLPGTSTSAQSPAWSTAATPGTPGQPLDAAVSRSVRRAQVSGELEGRSDGSITPVEESPSRKEVRFTPSVAGGTSPPANLSTLPPTADPEQTGLPPGFMPDMIMPDPSAPPLDDVPPGFVHATSPISGEHDLYETSPSSHPPIPPPSVTPYSPPRPPPGLLSPDAHISSAAPAIPPSAPVAPSPIFPVAPPPAPVIPVAPAPVIPVASARTMPVFDATVTAVPVELTPQVIARAQKHCRFAISALDYEDAEQARKELRAALRMLGG